MMHIVLDFIGHNNEYLKESNTKEVFAYISDISNGNIVIFDWKRDISYKKTALEMKQKALTFEVSGHQFNTRSGIRGLALQSNPNLKVQLCLSTNLFTVTLSKIYYSFNILPMH